MMARFRLQLPPGHYTLVIRRPGYAPAVREIAIDGGPTSPLQIALTPSPFRLEPITVTATRQPLAAEGSSLSATALRR